MNSVRRNASAGLLALAALAACVAARADTVTLRDGTTLEGIIMIETDTKIVLNSRQATLADLQPQDRVKVRYDDAQHAMTLVAVRS